MDGRAAVATAEEAARVLHIGRTTLYALIKDGQLRSVHIGRSYRLTRAELQRCATRLDTPMKAPGPKTTRARRPPGGTQGGLFDLDRMPPEAA